jgi:hypothetical protein
VPINCGLPRQKLIDRKHVTAGGFINGQQSTTHGRNHFGLTPDDPAFRAGLWQIGNGQ